MDDYSDFYRAQFRSVTRTVYLIVQDSGRAEEIAQEAFIRLYQHWRKVEHYDNVGAWVRRVALNLAIKHVRRERQRPRVEADHGPPEPTGPRDLDVLRAVAGLPARQRAAVVLFYFEDRTVEQIGELLGCTTSTAKVTLHRARKALAPLLVEEVGADVP